MLGIQTPDPAADRHRFLLLLGLAADDEPFDADELIGLCDRLFHDETPVAAYHIGDIERVSGCRSRRWDIGDAAKVVLAALMPRA